MAKKFLTGLNLVVLDTDPATGSEGELYFNSSASVAKIYQAGSWSVLGVGGGGTTVSTTEPDSPETGDSWYKNDTGEFYIYDGTYWVEVNGIVENPPISQEEVQDYVAPLFEHGNHINITASYNDENNEIVLTGSSPGSDSFKTISVSGQSDVVADSSTDTLTLVAGTNVSITTNATNDSITINADSKSTSSVYLVRNNTGSTILKGTLVSASGAEPSGRIDVEPFAAVGGINSELTVMGMATTNISNGVNGEVISFGTLTGIDTRGDTTSAIAVGDETWAEGDILFAHPTVAGKLTKVRPQHDLAVAFITVRHASTGQIAVRIVPGNNHLEWMHDVLIDGTPADNEVLAYDSTSGLWKNQTASEAGLVTLAGTETLTNKTLTTPKINEDVTITATSTELNVLDGITASTTELNYVDGVTSAIQTQLNDKSPLASPTFTGTVTIPSGASIDGYLTTSTASSTYLTQTNAASTYQPIGSYLTSEADTFETVTDRGATSTNAITISNTTQASSPETGALIISGGLGVAKDVWIDGDLHVNGTTVTENTKTVATHDNMIYLNAALDSTVTNAVGDGTYVTYTAENNYTPGMDIRVTGMNPSGYNIATSDLLTVYSATSTQFVVAKTTTGTFVSGGTAHAKEEVNPDLGFAGGYYSSGYAHAGLFRDASDGVFKFFQGYTPEPDEAVNIDTTHASFAFADIAANSVTLSGDLSINGGDLTSSASTVNLFVEGIDKNINIGTSPTPYTNTTGLFEGYLSNINGDLASAGIATFNQDVKVSGPMGNLIAKFGFFDKITVKNALPYSIGGTGLTTLGTAGQVLKVNSGATGLEWGTVDLSLYAPIASPTFTGTVTLSGDLAINGGDITSSASTVNLFNGLQTINIGNLSDVVPGQQAINIASNRSAPIVNIGNSSTATAGQINIGGGYITSPVDVVISGDVSFPRGFTATGQTFIDDIFLYNNLELNTGNITSYSSTVTLFADGTNQNISIGSSTISFADTDLENYLSYIGEYFSAAGNRTTFNHDVEVAGSFGNFIAKNGYFDYITVKNVLPYSIGGTGLTTIGTAGQSLVVNTTGDGLEWSDTVGGGSVEVSETPPASPSEGDLWYNSLTGQMLVYYDNFWIESSSAVMGPEGPQGPEGPEGPQGPEGPAGVDGGISIPQNQQVSAYTLALSDRGKHIRITTGGVTVPSGVFSVGDNFAIFNDSTSSQTITQGGGVTLRLAASTSTGNRTLAGYGLCTIMCVSDNVFVIVGAGVS
jgi:hypothetical protein